MDFQQPMQTKITVIELFPPEDYCCVCNEMVTMDYGLPMYEGEILPPAWDGEWGGFTACQRCYERFRSIPFPISVNDAIAAVNGDSLRYSGA